MEIVWNASLTKAQVEKLDVGTVYKLMKALDDVVLSVMDDFNIEQ
jgi:hypothetical protein